MAAIAALAAAREWLLSLQQQQLLRITDEDAKLWIAVQSRRTGELYYRNAETQKAQLDRNNLVVLPRGPQDLKAAKPTYPSEPASESEPKFKPPKRQAIEPQSATGLPRATLDSKLANRRRQSARRNRKNVLIFRRFQHWRSRKLCANPACDAVVVAVPPRRPSSAPADLKVEQLLGAGAFSRVFAVSGGASVVKCAARSDPVAFESVLRDEHFLRRLAPHAQVVVVLDSFVHKDCYALQLPRALCTLAATDPDAQHFACIDRQLRAGCLHIHERRVVHLDIKPSNVLVFLEKGGHCFKLADFGSAASEKSALCPCQMYHTTRPYRAPELCVYRQKRLAERSMDYWSLGALFLQLGPGPSIGVVPQNSVEQLLLCAALVGVDSAWGLPPPSRAWALPELPEHCRHLLRANPLDRSLTYICL